MVEKAPSEPGLPGRSWKTHEPTLMTPTEQRSIDGLAFGDGDRARIFWRCILQRFICGGSRIVQDSAGKPRFGRSLSLP